MTNVNADSHQAKAKNSFDEVWGKVMFLQVFVCPRRGGAAPEGSASGGGSAFRKAGGTHPTGMISCFFDFFRFR